VELVSAVIRKVFAYITQGNRLLVFRHADFPEAGLQVPAGTVRLDERPEDAVLREAFEETGV
jgi:ADP-ribose pyrophosphatase YjhB (NUDIX family)